MNTQRLSSFVGSHATKLTGAVTSTHAFFERTVEGYWVWFKRHAATPVRVIFAAARSRCPSTLHAAKVPWLFLARCHVAGEWFAAMVTDISLSWDSPRLGILLEALYGGMSMFWRQVLPVRLLGFADGWPCQPVECCPVTVPGTKTAGYGWAGKELFAAKLANMKNLSTLPVRMVLWCCGEINTIASTAAEASPCQTRRDIENNSTLFASQIYAHLRRILSRLVRNVKWPLPI